MPIQDGHSPGHSVLDFLSLPFRDGDGISRRDGRFASDRPWGVARFGSCRVNAGWWRLECATVAGVVSELHLSSPHDPLMVIPVGAAGTARFKLSGAESYEISLLLSPWPGEIAFDALRLTRLDFANEAALLARGVWRVLTRKGALRLLVPVLRRLMSGRSLALNVASPPEARAAPARPHLPQDAKPLASTASLKVRPTGQGDTHVALGVRDSLHAGAAELVAAEFARLPEAHIIYGDVCEGGEIVPKPHWDAELAREFDYVGTPVFFRGAVEASAAQSRDWLRTHLASAPGGSIHRIALPLADRPALASVVVPSLAAPVLSRTPRVSMIVPTKMRLDLLEKCLDGLINRTDYPEVEVIVVDNGSEDPRFPGVLERASKSLNLVRVEDHGNFNFPRLINGGVARSTGEIVVLLNDDVEAIDKDWLTRMVEAVLVEDVGAVGCRLIYPDGRIQHAGVTMGLGGVCGHLWKGLTPDAAARNPYVMLPGERTAVTGACLALRRNVFDRIKGLDEATFPVAFNDIDLCLRLRAAGYRTIFRGDAVLIHHESQSRGADHQTAEKRERIAVETAKFLDRWRGVVEEDRFGSPAFDPMSETGSVHRALRGVCD